MVLELSDEMENITVPNIKINYRLNEAKDYYGEIPRNIENRIKKGDKFDFVFENLQTHDCKKLQKKLIEKFADKIEFFATAVGKGIRSSFFIVVKNGINENDFKQDNELNQIFEFFNYYISFCVGGEQILVEPLYSENCNDYVLNKCRGICYHVTYDKYAEVILQKGLRCRKGTYRDFPLRIFLFATEKQNLMEYSKQELNNFFKRIIDIPNYFTASRKRIKDEKKNWEDGDLGAIRILKINLNRFCRDNVNFYKDTAMPDEETVFTYNNIPSECIKDVTSDALLRYIYL